MKQFIEQGFHNDAFKVALREIHFELSVDFWTRECISAYQMVINNIYISEGDIDGHAINFFEVIEREDSLKLCASVWEVDVNGKMVLTRAIKVIISKEPLPMLLRLLGNELDSTIFSLIQHGTTLSLE